MSAAPNLAPHAPQEEIQIGGITTAPAARPTTRPAPKKRFKPAGPVAIGSVWMLFMALCFMLVQKNAEIRTVNADILRAREEIVRLEQANLALEGQIANQVSVAEVQRWARAHNMKPPTGVVQTLQGKQDAIAVRHLPDAAPAPSQAARENKSFWQALLARFGGSTNQAAGAKE